MEVVRHPDIDNVVELIGGDTLARQWVMEAIAQGKHVATANKVSPALYGHEIFSAAPVTSVRGVFASAAPAGIFLLYATCAGSPTNHIHSGAGAIYDPPHFL